MVHPHQTWSWFCQHCSHRYVTNNDILLSCLFNQREQTLIFLFIVAGMRLGMRKKRGGGGKKEGERGR